MDKKNNNFKFRAMVVNKDIISRNILVQKLNSYGYQVFESSQYEVAIRAFIALKPTLVFLDQDLEGLCGLDVAFFLRRLTGGMYTKIFLYTSLNESMLKSEPNYQFIDGYIKKGDFNKLLSIVKEYEFSKLAEISEVT